jgi:hypothetical protein
MRSILIDLTKLRAASGTKMRHRRQSSAQPGANDANSASRAEEGGFDGQNASQVAATPAPWRLAKKGGDHSRRRIFDVTQSSIQIGMTVFAFAIVSASKPMQNSA